MFIRIHHHGAINGFAGSYHQLHINKDNSILIDCGLFQGEEAKSKNEKHLDIDFDICNVKALLVIHCHIDHVGRIPHTRRWL